MAWVRPTSHTANSWTDAVNAYDSNTGTTADNTTPRNDWTDYLEMYLDTIECSEIRIYTSRQNPQVTTVEFDIRYNGNWTNVYSGEPTDEGGAVTATIDPVETVDGVRVRFYGSQARTCRIHDTELFEVEEVIPEGGSEAAVNVSAEGSGEKAGAGSSETFFNVSAEGSGIKIAAGSSEAIVTVEAEGAGEVGAVTFEGGSESQVIVLAEADGMKQSRSPPAEAELLAQAEGAGIKAGQGSSEGTVETEAEGVGEKVASGNSESGVSVNAEGGGHKVVPDYAEGSSQVEVVINTEGAGEAFRQGSSESEVTVSGEGEGQANRQGSSESEVSASAEGEGRKLATGSSEASVVVSAEGAGVAVEETEEKSGGSEASVEVSTQGYGLKVASGSSEATTSITSEGQGQKQAAGSVEAETNILTEGQGTKRVEGFGDAVVVILVEGSGEVYIRRFNFARPFINRSLPGRPKPQRALPPRRWVKR